ncbi:DUF805 domain-containing protein [Gordonia sp. ABSL1-1]|uniref:DUF805 domain-containing protein n=1 Tax=Gordonia sp. ABSL1-1 TaxID=3053923 RepID=UPI002572CB84|nr:DUF805 domain-containing protein [Gordonia sp. ABSL1-1]MDL9938204.1 DUF805 domain-containing protein [Gordonia sp. ABSL1-1]
MSRGTAMTWQDPNNPHGEQAGWSSDPRQPYEQTQYGQQSYGQPQHGQEWGPVPGSQPQYGQPQYGQPQYGQPQYGQPQYGQPYYGQAPYGRPEGTTDPNDLRLPLYGATFGQGVARYFKNYVNFSGRASQSEYWWPVLMMLLASTVITIVLIVLALVGESTGAGGVAALAGFLGILLLVFALATILPSISVAVRRLHDANQSGAWLLCIFIPFVGGLTSIVIGLLPSDPAGVQYDDRI